MKKNELHLLLLVINNCLLKPSSNHMSLKEKRKKFKSAAHSCLETLCDLLALQWMLSAYETCPYAVRRKEMPHLS